MKAKFVMEVTITELVNPLLYARLSACSTPRERAAVFRACAEAHLRDKLTGISAAPERHPVTGAHNVTPTAGSSLQEPSMATQATPPSTAVANEPVEDFRTLRTENPGGTSGSFSEILGSQLSDFFESE